MTSAGGLEPAVTIRPKDMLLSGPAGGAIGAANAARCAGHSRIITFDMGGTSTDVALIQNEVAQTRRETRVADVTVRGPGDCTVTPLSAPVLEDMDSAPR